MIKFFRKVRRNFLYENKLSKYLIYAFGEIILVVIGILLAVYINEQITENRNNTLRCTYLEELKFTFEYDIKDVEENIMAFEKWNPKLEKLLTALREKNLEKLDSIDDKINTASRYIYFGQRSKSKIEELKYANINLIKNRDLKNKILLYQDNDIHALLNAERRYNLVDEAQGQYFSKNIIGNNITLKDLENDNQFFSVVYQKYNMNKGMKIIYEYLLEEQYEIKKILESELEKNCNRKE